MDKLINPWVLLGVLLALIAAAAGGFKLGGDHQRAKAAERAALIREAADEFERRAAEQIANIKPIHQTIQGKTHEIVTEKPVYRECINDPVVSRLLDDARANRAPIPNSDSSVP